MARLTGTEANIARVEKMVKEARQVYKRHGISNMRVSAALLRGQAKVLMHIADSIDMDCDTGEKIITNINPGESRIVQPGDAERRR